RRGRNSLFTALFFLLSFFFCAFLVKRKSATNKFVQYYKLNIFGLQAVWENFFKSFPTKTASFFKSPPQKSAPRVESFAERKLF
ncbi:MAG: hypothetical protein IJW92_08305, partial [Clostridia bacterium]|nr:hypothetical protein [Clostridia bacterium]